MFLASLPPEIQTLTGVLRISHPSSTLTQELVIQEEKDEELSLCPQQQGCVEAWWSLAQNQQSRQLQIWCPAAEAAFCPADMV